jgi:hypothetical protein
MNTKRTLAIAIALASLATAGTALADDRPGRGYEPQERHGERHDQRYQRYGYDAHRGYRDDDRKRRHDDKRADKRTDKIDKKIDRRQDKQMQRIREGWRSGDLTREELAQLKRQQQRIEQMQRRFDDDGRYSRAERERLNKALKRADKRIKAARHDDDQRRAYRYYGDDRWRQQNRWDYADFPRHPGAPWFPWSRWTD